jgi:RNA polymerase sigma-70 factor (family 1)
MTKKNATDEELIRGLNNGDKKLFNELFQQYYSLLCSYALSIVKFPNVAEEVVQDTFVKLWENHANIEIKVSLKFYLVRCVHNNCLNVLKNNEIRFGNLEKYRNEISYHAQLLFMNFSEDMLDDLISEEFNQAVLKQVNELPGQCKDVFYLSRYENLTYNEIAKKLGISVNTVKTQMHRAFDKLKEALRNI